MLKQEKTCRYSRHMVTCMLCHMDVLQVSCHLRRYARVIMKVAWLRRQTTKAEQEGAEGPCNTVKVALSCLLVDLLSLVSPCPRADVIVPHVQYMVDGEPTGCQAAPHQRPKVAGQTVLLDRRLEDELPSDLTDLEQPGGKAIPLTLGLYPWGTIRSPI